MADFIGGGLPTVAPSAASHSDPNASTESPAPISTLEPPTSNPGSEDPSAGIAKNAGGTSNTAHIDSPVTEAQEEKKTIVGTVLETVFGKQERSADEFESSAAAPTTTTTEERNKENATVASTTGSDQATGAGAPGVLGAVAGAAAAGTAAVASYVGLSNNNTTTPQEEGEKTAASVEKSAAETQAAAGEKADEVVESAKEATTGSDSADATGEKKSHADEAHEKAHDTSHVGSHVGNTPKQVSDHEAATRENKEAIPTAGGEKLGTAHEGESKMIPDVPPETADESKPGQPDATTADNTAKNAGAAPTTATDSTPSSAHKNEGSNGKHKFMDKVKAKLHLDKKDKS